MRELPIRQAKGKNADVGRSEDNWVGRLSQQSVPYLYFRDLAKVTVILLGSCVSVSLSITVNGDLVTFFLLTSSGNVSYAGVT